MTCIRCGGNEHIEIHHIIQRIDNGSDEPENLEERCRVCHKYEHTLRALEASLAYETQRGQADRIKCYKHRIQVLQELNTPKLVRERGIYLSYWTDRTTRYLPRKILTKQEAQEKQQFYLLLKNAMEKQGVLI